jgi:micrococcal nuclease
MYGTVPRWHRFGVISFRKVGLLVVAALAGLVVAIAVTEPSHAAADLTASPAWFTLKAKVTRVVDGDTVVVKIGQQAERVRLLGIDTPEVGTCYSSEATTLAKKLTLNRLVTLRGDRSQGRRDRYGRLLAYVQVPGGKDAGRELLRAGRAHVYVFNKPFARLATYQAAETEAHNASLGLWAACTAPPTTSTLPTSTVPTTQTTTTTTTTMTTPPTSTTTGSNCAPSYPDVCIPPPPPDLDCGQISYKRFRVIYTVPNPDPHRFDGDRDGVGCES